MKTKNVPEFKDANSTTEENPLSTWQKIARGEQLPESTNRKYIM